MDDSLLPSSSSMLLKNAVVEENPSLGRATTFLLFSSRLQLHAVLTYWSFHALRPFHREADPHLRAELQSLS